MCLEKFALNLPSMIHFFQSAKGAVLALESSQKLTTNDLRKLSWLLDGLEPTEKKSLKGPYVGPRKEMITPWSTNAVEITRNMGIEGIIRMEEFIPESELEGDFDPMLQMHYPDLDQEVFNIQKTPEPILEIHEISAYNDREGLALSDEEIYYLESVSKAINRPLTDSEIFGFSQINSEHCRHKIFNGTFIIDGKEMPSSLFALIKKTSSTNYNELVSAYSDNVAFIKGPLALQFAPKTQDTPDFFRIKEIETILSLKAETHNFPTTVEPFNGAATGSGGEIRDRMAGGTGSIPLAGTAVYMTSYPRLNGGRSWEKGLKPRKWLYQNPLQILIKASDGASDYGNKFGQPLICGSLLTFEHEDGEKSYGFDKVIMLAGGIGYAKKIDSHKKKPNKGDRLVVMGGDNYRIGMGGGAVSSVATGEFKKAIELNAIQRSNPEMQKRVMNAIRALAEDDNNPIVSIHDHGAGGHLNCLSELVEETGGVVYTDKLPIGDPTLSEKEIAGNESQERMGLVVAEKDLKKLQDISKRERAPMYDVGVITGDQKFKFLNSETQKASIDLELSHLFGSSPKTILKDDSVVIEETGLSYDIKKFEWYLEQVLQLESVACKDWLTNKVDRSVTGRVATQQTCGALQLPLNNLGVMALDYESLVGTATSIGHAPVLALLDPMAGSRVAVAEALTNLVWAPLTHGLKGVSLSANWMWPAKNTGENFRLYKAVEAISDFVCELGINIPTGKDSLSMTQKYPDGKTVFSPGTVIVSTVAAVSDITKTITPELQPLPETHLIYVDFSGVRKGLGGSAFSQVNNVLGGNVPDIKSAKYLADCFEGIQQLIKENLILAGHDIGSGGLVTTLLEMCFPSTNVGMKLDLSGMADEDLVETCFAENPGLVIQVSDLDATKAVLNKNGINFQKFGHPIDVSHLEIHHHAGNLELEIPALRKLWFKTSYLLDQEQRSERLARQRWELLGHQPLKYRFPKDFTGTYQALEIKKGRTNPTGIKGAIIREKGVNGDREMAYAMHLAGFDVKDIHMTDLIAGRADLSDLNFIAFVGGFSNSDVLGSAKGWAGAFLYNDKARESLNDFYAREDTLSLGVCNGCQLMMHMGLVYPELGENHPRMHHNESGKFESVFINLDIQDSPSVMLKSLSGSRLGVWLAHGEGKFVLPGAADQYHIPAVFSYPEYPGNPNGSDFNAAALCSNDGRHLAIMPHLERSLFTWNWPYLPDSTKTEVLSPWIEAFINARKWVESR